jgi:hypothetical protein
MSFIYGKIGQGTSNERLPARTLGVVFVSYGPGIFGIREGE